MQLKEVHNIKNLQSDNKFHTVKITVGQHYKDDSHKFKLKNMIQVGIPLCVIIGLIAIYFTIRLYDTRPFSSPPNTNISQISEKMFDLKLEKNQLLYRVKREEEENYVENRNHEILEKAVLNCNKNIEKNKNCCDLWRIVKEMNLIMDDVKKEFDLTNVPCKDKENVHLNIKEKDENNSQSEYMNEVEDQNEHYDEEYDANFDIINSESVVDDSSEGVFEAVGTNSNEEKKLNSEEKKTTLKNLKEYETTTLENSNSEDVFEAVPVNSNQEENIKSEENFKKHDELTSTTEEIVNYSKSEKNRHSNDENEENISYFTEKTNHVSDFMPSIKLEKVEATTHENLNSEDVQEINYVDSSEIQNLGESEYDNNSEDKSFKKQINTYSTTRHQNSRDFIESTSQNSNIIDSNKINFQKDTIQSSTIGNANDIYEPNVINSNEESNSKNSFENSNSNTVKEEDVTAEDITTSTTTKPLAATENLYLNAENLISETTKKAEEVILTTTQQQTTEVNVISVSITTTEEKTFENSNSINEKSVTSSETTEIKETSLTSTSSAVTTPKAATKNYNLGDVYERRNEDYYKSENINDLNTKKSSENVYEPNYKDLADENNDFSIGNKQEIPIISTTVDNIHSNDVFEASYVNSNKDNINVNSEEVYEPNDIKEEENNFSIKSKQELLITSTTTQNFNNVFEISYVHSNEDNIDANTEKVYEPNNKDIEDENNNFLIETKQEYPIKSTTENINSNDVFEANYVNSHEDNMNINSEEMYDPNDIKEEEKYSSIETKQELLLTSTTTENAYNKFETSYVHSNEDNINANTEVLYEPNYENIKEENNTFSIETKHEYPIKSTTTENINSNHVFEANYVNSQEYNINVNSEEVYDPYDVKEEKNNFSIENEQELIITSTTKHSNNVFDASYVHLNKDNINANTEEVHEPNYKEIKEEEHNLSISTEEKPTIISTTYKNINSNSVFDPNHSNMNLSSEDVYEPSYKDTNEEMDLSTGNKQELTITSITTDNSNLNDVFEPSFVNSNEMSKNDASNYVSITSKLTTSTTTENINSDDAFKPSYVDSNEENTSSKISSKRKINDLTDFNDNSNKFAPFNKHVISTDTEENFYKNENIAHEETTTTNKDKTKFISKEQIIRNADLDYDINFIVKVDDSNESKTKPVTSFIFESGDNYNEDNLYSSTTSTISNAFSDEINNSHEITITSTTEDEKTVISYSGEIKNSTENDQTKTISKEENRKDFNSYSNEMKNSNEDDKKVNVYSNEINEYTHTTTNTYMKENIHYFEETATNSDNYINKLPSTQNYGYDERDDFYKEQEEIITNESNNDNADEIMEDVIFKTTTVYENSKSNEQDDILIKVIVSENTDITTPVSNSNLDNEITNIEENINYSNNKINDISSNDFSIKSVEKVLNEESEYIVESSSIKDNTYYRKDIESSTMNKIPLISEENYNSAMDNENKEPIDMEYEQNNFDFNNYQQNKLTITTSTISSRKPEDYNLDTFSKKSEEDQNQDYDIKIDVRINQNEITTEYIINNVNQMNKDVIESSEENIYSPEGLSNDYNENIDINTDQSQLKSNEIYQILTSTSTSKQENENDEDYSSDIQYYTPAYLNTNYNEETTENNINAINGSNDEDFNLESSTMEKISSETEKSSNEEISSHEFQENLNANKEYSTTKQYNFQSSEDYNINIKIDVEDKSFENVHPMVSPYTEKTKAFLNEKTENTEGLHTAETKNYYKTEENPEDNYYRIYEQEYYNTFNKHNYEQEPKIENFPKNLNGLSYHEEPNANNEISYLKLESTTTLSNNIEEKSQEENFNYDSVLNNNAEEQLNVNNEILYLKFESTSTSNYNNDQKSQEDNFNYDSISNNKEDENISDNLEIVQPAETKYKNLPMSNTHVTTSVPAKNTSLEGTYIESTNKQNLLSNENDGVIDSSGYTKENSDIAYYDQDQKKAIEGNGNIYVKGNNLFIATLKEENEEATTLHYNADKVNDISDENRTLSKDKFYNKRHNIESNEGNFYDWNESSQEKINIPVETVPPPEPEKQLYITSYSKEKNGRKKYETNESSKEKSEYINEKSNNDEKDDLYEEADEIIENVNTSITSEKQSRQKSSKSKERKLTTLSDKIYSTVTEKQNMNFRSYETFNSVEDIKSSKSKTKNLSKKTGNVKDIETKNKKKSEESENSISSDEDNYHSHTTEKNEGDSNSEETITKGIPTTENLISSTIYFKDKTTRITKNEELDMHSTSVPDENAPITRKSEETITIPFLHTTVAHINENISLDTNGININTSTFNPSLSFTTDSSQTESITTVINENITMDKNGNNISTLISITFTTDSSQNKNTKTNTNTDITTSKDDIVDNSEFLHTFEIHEKKGLQTLTEEIKTTQSITSSPSEISQTVSALVDLITQNIQNQNLTTQKNFQEKNVSETQTFETSTSVVTSSSVSIINETQTDSILGTNQNSNQFKLINDFIAHDSQTANLQAQNQLQNNINDMRIVNQNQIAQRFQNIGSQTNNKGNGGTFDNLFQLPPIESSKASQQLTVNTNMLPMCFYGMPNQNAAAFRQPGYDSQISPFSSTNTAFSAFGYPQMYPNNMGQQAMYNYYNNMMAQQKFGSQNFMNHMQNPYFCTYVPSSSLQFPPISGVPDFRNVEPTEIPILEDPDDKTIPIDFFPHLQSNKSRSSKSCRHGEISCFDGKKCIREIQWCDGVVQCHDQSDELGCPCKSRVDKSRLCDGYFDCPNGEDELGCFGCSEKEFSCDDWTERRKTATCVPLEERCDGRSQCKTGKDEMDCSLLTNAINVHQTHAVSKSSGYLHRNYKGNWYPVCSNTDNWVLDACLAEVGPQATFPLIRMLPVPANYKGKYLTALSDKKAEFLNACMGGEAVYVICPPIPCGTRLLPPPNHYRKHEVDTSAEEDFLPIVSRLRRFTDEIKNRGVDILGTNDLDEKIYQEYYKNNNHLQNNEQIKESKVQNKKPSKKQDRGKRGDSRVVGGKPSQPTSWPWVVAIYRDGIFHCGGVLMSELWVITAAHCIDTYWQHYYEVQAGMLRRFSYSPMEQNRVVSNIIGHQLYDRTDMKNDLALLKVSRPFQFNRWVRPVCLPSESSAGPNWLWGPTPGTICTAVGWGATVEHGPDPDHMREVEVPILAHCKHREDEEGQEICAGYLEGGRDACQGDSGGPLLCRNPLAPSQWYVAGIVSHGEGCARPNEPGAYTRVSLYLNWIARSILDENLPGKRPLTKCPGILCMGTHRCIAKKRRCDKTIDCLVGDDEINCPTNNFPSLIKHALDNMLLFSTNNVTTTDPDDASSEQSTRKSVGNNNNMSKKNEKSIIKTGSNSGNTIITIPSTSTDSTIENDSITSSAFREDGGQASAMNRNGDISSTFMSPTGEISDVTRSISNMGAAEATSNTAQRPSIKATTFITTNDTISESSTSRMSVNATTPVNDVTVTTSIHNDNSNGNDNDSSAMNPTSTVINDSRGALNNGDKNMLDARRKNETTFSKDMNTATEISIMENTTVDSKKSSAPNIIADKFLCKNLIQVISISRRCNRIIDCEDGTDEIGCSCKEYLAAYYPEAICDGTMDCEDGGDEKNCNDCPETKFYCHLSGQCIPKFYQCDYKSDCLFGEDEWDCFALTNGSFIRYDKDERPELRRKGIITVSHAGLWYPMCKSDWYDIAPDVADDMCIYLGFGGYQKFYQTFTIQESIRQISMDTHPISVKPKTNDTCRALYVKCTNSLSDHGSMRKGHAAHQTGVNTFKELLISPWNAGIFVNGYYTCSGTLVDKEWVITSRICMDDIYLYANYTTVMLGSGKGHQNVVGPHEQIRHISEIVSVTNTDIVLLRLYKPITSTRYVRPLYLRKANNVVTEKETCIAMGRDINETMQAIFLKPVLDKCLMGERCFHRVSPNADCDDSTLFLSPWGGIIVCLSPIGWYPAAVYYERQGQCGFKSISGYSSIRYLTPNILAAMNNEALTVNPPICSGFRCPLGQCIESERICDGTANCRDGSDESRANCQKKTKECQSKNNCECAQTEMRCKNGKCVAKSAFCDRRDDCGDLSDEPPVCNCSAYLALVAPYQICDGIRNCYDKSDENPDVCKCGKNSFKCGTSGVCISNDFVCDGEADCPDNEDEFQCTALFAKKETRDGVGELMLRTYGVWHSFCMPDTPLTAKQLEDICIDLSFTGAHASIRNTTAISNSARVIQIDQFSFVKLNTDATVYLRGDYPLATVKRSSDCKTMYLECT